MEKKINLENGYLILHSDEAVEWCNSLIASGLFWETLSTLVNSHVVGASTKQEGVVTKDDLDSLRNDILRHLASLPARDSGSTPPLSPSFFGSVSESSMSKSTPVEERSGEVKRPKLNFNKGAKRNVSTEDIVQRLGDLDKGI